MQNGWRLPLIGIVLAIVGLTLWAILPVYAQDDGRINKTPWVNSYGAIAVYCVDQSGKPGLSFAGGGVKLLNGSGRQIFYAAAATINTAMTRAEQRNASVVVRRQSVYILTARPGGYLLLTSLPDAEGKTFLGEWKDCSAISAESTPVPPTPGACVPRFIRNEADSGDRCDLCNNGEDDDCNGKPDALDFACQYYCGR